MITRQAPAKINLFLNVFPKRSDGYHGLQTLFECVGLTDKLAFKHKPAGIKLKVSGIKVSSGEDNLIWKAADLLRKKYRVKSGVEIQLQKRIPVAAGLGGGSSDAAAALMALNRLWKLRLSKKKLMALGAGLGSDVPFFICETPYALAGGRGEVLKPVSSTVKLWHCLVKPPFGISTREAYQAFDAKPKGERPPQLTPKKADVRMLFHLLQNGDSGRLPGLLNNSLELVINKRVMAISEIKKKLISAGAFVSLMSGSGSCVFGLFRNRSSAVRAARILRQRNKSWKVFVVGTY